MVKKAIPTKAAPKIQPIVGNLYEGACPTRTVLDHITARWSMLIIILLMERKRRFSELARVIGGVSEKMLAQSLRSLEDDGFVQRTVYPTKPPSVEYCLTPMGKELAPRVRALTEWVQQNLVTVLAHREGKDSVSRAS